MTEFILALYGFLFIMAILLVMAMLWKICCLPRMMIEIPTASVVDANRDNVHIIIHDDVRIVVHPDESVMVGSLEK